MVAELEVADNVVFGHEPIGSLGYFDDVFCGCGLERGGAVDADKGFALVAYGPCGEIGEHSAVDVSMAVDSDGFEHDGYGAGGHNALGYGAGFEGFFGAEVEVGCANNRFDGEVFEVFEGHDFANVFFEAVELEE